MYTEDPVKALAEKGKSGEIDVTGFRKIMVSRQALKEIKGTTTFWTNTFHWDTGFFYKLRTDLWEQDWSTMSITRLFAQCQDSGKFNQTFRNCHYASREIETIFELFAQIFAIDFMKPTFNSFLSGMPLDPTHFHLLWASFYILHPSFAIADLMADMYFEHWFDPDNSKKKTK